MEEFYRLHCATRQRHGVPPQPRSFFRQIEKQLLRENLGFLALARLHDRPVAPLLFLQWGPLAIFKFGASDRAWQALRPNHLVMWTGIRHLLETGAAVLDFGRTNVGQKGLRRFKLSWGAHEENLSYLRLSPTR